MASTTAARQTSASTINPDLSALKIRQQAAWSSGNYAVVGTTLQIVGEQLCETLDLRAGAKVLDVAAGNGMVTLAAARRWCDVTSTDYVPALLEQGRARLRGRPCDRLHGGRRRTASIR
jgi:2-polyprenyl-3-methyl-5-hydroxy-6-metoxy-1,4-benzoquinol methylase